eukprot:Colp12_sorted_trinity150504_noHs@31878
MAEEAVQVPEGIVPLFFTAASQELFKCRSAQNEVTAEQPHVLIPKAQIVEDFKNRAAVSDFHPVKDTVLNYPGEELLLVYDDEYKYGQNFYLCVTEEAKDRLLHPEKYEEHTPGEEGFQFEEVAEKKERVRGWTHLGSDAEIVDERFAPNRPLLNLIICRARRHFGGAFAFSDRDAKQSVVELKSYQDSSFQLQKLEHDIG